MGSILYILLILACPLGMMFMMRGMMGGGKNTDTTVQERRIADLEQEVGRLRGSEANLSGAEAKRDLPALTGRPQPRS